MITILSLIWNICTNKNIICLIRKKDSTKRLIMKQKDLTLGDVDEMLDKAKFAIHKSFVGCDQNTIKKMIADVEWFEWNKNYWKDY